MMTSFDGIGIVVAGGASTRMGVDKAMLNYQGIKWIDRAYALLSTVCPTVYVSCNKVYPQHYDQFPLIVDRYEHIGPLASIEAAFSRYPNSALFVLAVDMPLLDHHLLSTISLQRDPSKDATLPYTEVDARWHPLCGIYESHCKKIIQDQIDQHVFALWRLLEKLNVQRISLRRSVQLTNVNTPEEFDGLPE